MHHHHWTSFGGLPLLILHEACGEVIKQSLLWTSDTGMLKSMLNNLQHYSGKVWDCQTNNFSITEKQEAWRVLVGQKESTTHL